MEMPDVPPIAKLLGDLKKWMPAASSTRPKLSSRNQMICARVKIFLAASILGFLPFCGIICPVGECEPQAKHELIGIDTVFLSEHERYARCELRNMV